MQGVSEYLGQNQQKTELDSEVKINVQFTCDIPDGASKDEIQAWLLFELNANGQLSGSNPLNATEIEADFMSVTFEEET